MVGNLPARAGEMGLIPGPGRFPQAMEQLSPCTTNTEPTPVFLPGESQGRGEPGGLPSMVSQRVGHD